VFPQADKPELAGYYSPDYPNMYTLFIADTHYDDNTITIYGIFIILHEFRHLYQNVATGKVTGLELQKDISDNLRAAWANGLENYTTCELAKNIVENDANNFAASKLGRFNWDANGGKM
jgi:hypothetical protein